MRREVGLELFEMLEGNVKASAFPDLHSYFTTSKDPFSRSLALSVSKIRRDESVLSSHPKLCGLGKA